MSGFQQQQQPAFQPTQVLTFNVEAQEMQIVLAGLGKLPLEAALTVFMKLQQQVQMQASTPAKSNGDARASVQGVDGGVLKGEDDRTAGMRT